MIGLVWNYRGIGQPSTLRTSRGFLKSHRPNFMFLTKVKCNNVVIVENIVRKLHFDKFEFISALGKAGGL